MSEISRSLKEKIDKALNTSNEAHSSKANDIEQNSDTYLALMNGLKQKMDGGNCTRSEKIQLHTLFPLQWSLNIIYLIFGTKIKSTYMVKIARQLFLQESILAKLPPKMGKPLKEWTAQKVVNFISDEQFSRIMPRIKHKGGI